MADTASDWGFLKLLVSLNTGLIGLVIYGYEHFSKLPYGRAFVPLCLILLSSSFLLTMRSAWFLVTVDTTLTTDSKTTIGQLPNKDIFIKHVMEHQKTLHRAIWFFAIGVALSVIYFVVAFAMPPVAATLAPVSYFNKKMECRAYEEGLQRKLDKNSKLAMQTVERIFYSPSLDSCVSVVYSLYSGPDGKTTVYMEDVLTEKLLWQAEYPGKGAGQKSFEGVRADVDRKVHEMGLDKGS